MHDRSEGGFVSHYRLIARLGEGGMGEVWVAHDEILGRRVALKAIRTEARLDGSARARFQREARILSHLDHPHICRIHDFLAEPDGDTLVLEFVEGRTLDEVIAGGLEIGEALRITGQINEALVAAHEAGVVHRDLKPGNVMLTSDGAVKVLDFGLARPVVDRSGSEASTGPIEASEPTDATEVRPTRATEGSERTRKDAIPKSELFEAPDDLYLTEHGVTTGTWRYMSPEQARGEGATAASDMFSLGLIVHELVTGRSAHPREIDRHELIERTLRGETLPVDRKGAHRDVVTLVESLKSPSPARRPTALDVREKLAWIHGRPRRLRRRIAGAAALLLIAIAALKYTLDLRSERERAERARGRAEDLIQFMLGDLHAKLADAGRLDILDAAGDKALDYFSSLSESRLEGADLFRRSLALRQIGEIRLAQGDLTRASELFEESAEALSMLVDDAPERGAWRKALGEAWFYIGRVQFERGDLDAATSSFERYARIAEELVARAPVVDEWQVELAYAYTNLAILLDAKGGSHAETIPILRSVIGIKQDLLDRDPGNVDRVRDLASGLSWLARVLDKSGDLEGALEQMESGRRVLRAAADRDANDTASRWRLSILLQHEGDLLDRLGRSEAAEECFRADLALATELSRHDPTNTEWRRGLAVSRRTAGMAALERGELETARTLLSASLLVQRQLVALDPGHRDWRRGLARAIHHLGRLELASEEGEAALRAARESASLLASLRDDAGGDGEDLTVPLAQASGLEGEALVVLGRPGEADEAFDRAYRIIEPVARGSEETDVLDAFTRILVHTGRRQEAGDVMSRLCAAGYARRSFLAFGRRHGLGPDAGRAGSHSPGTSRPAIPQPEVEDGE